MGREPIFSPRRVGDDHAILASVAEALNGNALELTFVPGEDPLDTVLLEEFDVVLTMRRDLRTLGALEAAESAFQCVINRPKAVRRCRRLHMLHRLQKHGLPVAPFQLIGTGQETELAFGWPSGGVWIKRSDVHCLHHGPDVVHVPGPRSLQSTLEDFRGRDMDEVIAQVHSPGVTVKCYAVDARVVGCSPDVPSLRRVMADVIARVGAVFQLEVFGVDLIVSPDLGISIVDVNDWPSFAACREAAAETIAANVLQRLCVAA